MNWTKTILICLSYVTLLGGITSCSMQSRIRKADRKYAIGEYYEAAKQYKQIYPRLKKKSEREQKAGIAFRQGECYRVLNSASAVTAYKNAIRLKYQDSIVYLRLAQCQQYQGKYQDATKNYTLYLQSYPDSYVAQAGLYACQQVKTWQTEPTRYKVSLAKSFNRSRTSNFSPAFIGDDADALMFTSNRPVSKKKTMVQTSPVTGKRTFNLFSARKDANGKWTDISLPDGLNNNSDNKDEADEQAADSTQTAEKAGTAELGVCSFTADGSTLFFTFSQPVNGQDLGTRIYRSERAGGEWGEPQEIKLFADSSISVAHPAINATGDTLYFVSDAPGGYGGKDIYRADGSGTEWGNVQNLGPQINTSDDELFPTIRRNGTLYFASEGHPGYGGLDIFKAIPEGRDTTYLQNTDKTPVYQLFNMGVPFNSREDDFGITFEGTSENGFFSSNRDQKSKNDRIYRFVLPELILSVEGKIQDEEGDPVTGSTLRLVGTDGTNQKVQVRRDGTYRLRLQPNAKYVMLATARGYLNQKQEIATTLPKESQTYTRDILLAPISKPVQMNNVFYEFGKWELTEQSSAELQGLVKLLNDNPNITIELSAHTDMVGDSLSNLTLSQKRAQACVEYLIKQGIEKERLTPVGYGKNKPVVATEAIHKQHSFIPEGKELTEEFILTLTKDQQEICNQINRRTEFKVLKTTYHLY
ncbi:MAG: OmpA family protein [Paludibacteraceae bacterium]|nr:OmpA family protein [Paludibacteraceae bacterium]